MDLAPSTGSKFSSWETCMTIRLLELMTRENLTAIGFPHPAILEMKEIFRARAGQPMAPRIVSVLFYLTPSSKELYLLQQVIKIPLLSRS